jgi:glutaredoxin
MADVRMYVNKGCPHCEAAQATFKERKVSVEAIEIGFDPILQAGIRAMSNNQGLPVPIIISYATQEVTVGNDAATLQRIADAIVSSRTVARGAASA